MKNALTVLLVLSIHPMFGNRLQDGFKALSIYDYFKAKHLFYKSLSKYETESAYGLATIYYRTDNPFSNIDSAAKYISISLTHFKDTGTFSGFHIDKNTIANLSHLIALKGFANYSQNKVPAQVNHYLIHFHFANDSLITESYNRRDIQLLEYYFSQNSSDSIQSFMTTYPESAYYNKALKQFYHLQYHETVDETKAADLKNFLQFYPKNPNRIIAENKLFELTKALHSTDSLYHFIEHYSTTETKEEAWKALYGESVKSYNTESLKVFMEKYPSYPYNELLIKEINLSQRVLIPLKNQDELLGYIDTLGNWTIAPIYDDAENYEEGYAVVCKNDTCIYINKEGQKTFNVSFEEAENYKSGIAIAKKDGLYYLLNKAGQFVSKGYQDISQSSNGLYVCQNHNWYGAINAKGEVIIPFAYKKLGNFKNGFAYYLTDAYGLVDIDNNTMEAQWDWVSDIDSNLLIIVKKNNRFGIINAYESVLLMPEYDYIAHCSDNIYLLVKNNLYNFYNSKEKCFIADFAFDYNPARDARYYSNGQHFTLLKEDEVGLMNLNGKMLINFGTFHNIFLTHQEAIRIQKNNKFGFLDRKLKAITSLEFDSAKDFENGLSVVSKNGNAQLINISGKIVFSLKGGTISALAKNTYKTAVNELYGIINHRGEMLLNTEFSSIEPLNEFLYRCEKTDGLYLFNCHTRNLKKL